MNKMLVIIGVVAVAVVAIAAATMLMDNDKNNSVENGSSLFTMGNISSNIFDLYLGEKDSSDMTLINDQGSYPIPSNAVILAVAKNPSGDVSVKENKIVIPTADDTYYVTIAFDAADKENPVIKDSKSAYVAFTPGKGQVNLGIFVTNMDSSATNTDAKLTGMGNLQTYLFNLYLGQKDSTDMVSVDEAGTFTIPDNPAMIIKAVNPDDMSVDGKKLIIKKGNSTYTVSIAFDAAQWDAPVITDTTTAYLTFTPTSKAVNLGIFVTS